MDYRTSHTVNIRMQILKSSFQKPDAYLSFGIVLVTLVVFSSLVYCDFVNFDDYALVTQNPTVLKGVTLEGIRWAFTTGYVANWIPLSWISHMVDVQLFGLNPAGHHAVSVLLHAANSALFFLFFKRVTGARWQSVAVALLFALHPLHVESVAWVAERKDVLSTLFWVLTMLTYLFYTEKPGIVRYGMTLVIFALGLLSKPMLVTLPLVLLLLDWWPFGRLARAETSGMSRVSIKRLVIEKIPFFALSLCSSVITYLVQDSAGTVFQGYTLLARLERVSISYMTYLYKTFWPLKLAVIYPFSKVAPTALEVIASLLALLLITAAVLLWRNRFPYLITGWLWYLITLLPVIGVVQIGQHSVADRYTYIPLVGVFVMCAWGLPELLGSSKSRRMVLASVSFATLFVLTFLTVMQLQHWKNSTTLFTHTVAVTENNWVALNNLGLVHLDEGRTDKAIEYFEASVAAKPSYSVAYLNLGYAYRAREDRMRSMDAFKKALLFEPGNPKAHLGLGLLYLELGERDQAVLQYQELKVIGAPFAEVLLIEIKSGTYK